MKKYEILQEAKKLLLHKYDAADWNCKSWQLYICHCIEDVTDRNGLREEFSQLQEHILSLIAPWHSFESWMIRQLGNESVEKDEALGCVKLQAARHALIDWLIQYYKDLDE